MLSAQGISVIRTDARTTFGWDTQYYLLIEELSELQKVICKVLRFKDTNFNVDITEEIADVKNMIEHIQVMHGITDDEVRAIQEMKLLRLRDRIAKGRDRE